MMKLFFRRIELFSLAINDPEGRKCAPREEVAVLRRAIGHPGNLRDGRSQHQGLKARRKRPRRERKRARIGALFREGHPSTTAAKGKKRRAAPGEKRERASEERSQAKEEKKSRSASFLLPARGVFRLFLALSCTHALASLCALANARSKKRSEGPEAPELAAQRCCCLFSFPFGRRSSTSTCRSKVSIPVFSPGASWRLRRRRPFCRRWREPRGWGPGGPRPWWRRC